MDLAKRSSNDSLAKQVLYVNHLPPGHRRATIWGEIGIVLGVRIIVWDNQRRGRTWRRDILSTTHQKKLVQLIIALTSGIRAAIISSIRALLWLRREDISACIICNGGIESIIILTIMQWKKIPVYLDVVDLLSSTQALDSRARTACELFAFRHAQYCFFVSASQLNEARSAGNVKANSSAWLPYGIIATDTQDWLLDQISARRSLYIAETNCVITWSGGLFIKDGQELNDLTLVIEGCEILASRLQVNVTLVLNGILPQDLHPLRHNPKDDKLEIRCLGRFEWGSSQHRLALSAANVLALPASPPLYNAHRAKVYDYMASGRPIVATQAVEMKTLLGQEAIWVDVRSGTAWADALERCWLTSRGFTKTRELLARCYTPQALAQRIRLMPPVPEEPLRGTKKSLA